MPGGPHPCVVGDGGLDKAVVRRYIKRELHKIQYCYEKELLANATISGETQRDPRDVLQWMDFIDSS